MRPLRLPLRMRGFALSPGAPCRIALFGLWVTVFALDTLWPESTAMPYVFGGAIAMSIGLGLLAMLSDLKYPKNGVRDRDP
jgi:hypothetical protein